MFYASIISFSFGILIGEFFDFGWSVALLASVLASVISFVLWKENSRIAKTILVIGLGLSLGLLRFSLVNQKPDQKLYHNLGQTFSFEATISDEPDIRDTSARYIVSPTIEADKANSKVLLVASRFPEFQYGDKISIEGELELPQNFENENGGEFDYISYLSKDNIHFIIYQPQMERVEEGEGNWLISRLYKIKNYFIGKINQVVPEPNSSLLGGLIFGAKQSLGNELLDEMRQVGLIHIVVLSGYNITVIAAAILYATSYFGKRKLSLSVSVVSIILFSLMVGLGATVVRASIMAFIVILARFLGRPNLALRALFVAGILMLIYNPLILVRDPSFQLSFMATLGLILFSPFVYEKLKFVPEWGALRETASSTLAVQLFLLPLLIKMSGVFSLVSFVVNLLVPPLVPYAMALGALTGAGGIISKIISWPFGTLSFLITEIIIKIVEISSKIPFAFLNVGSLPLWLVVLWYGAYTFLFWKLAKSKSKV